MNEERTNGGSVEIVLVEDIAADAAVALATLKKANIANKVHVIPDGGAILDFIFGTGANAHRAAVPEETLILLSMNLEGVHGLDVLRKLKSDERSKGFPVIMLTSSQEERGVMQSYKLGASGCIIKPLDLPKFIEAVSELRLGWLLISPDDAPPR